MEHCDADDENESEETIQVAAEKLENVEMCAGTVNVTSVLEVDERGAGSPKRIQSMAFELALALAFQGAWLMNGGKTQKTVL
jgi:hypothetical protein